MEDAVYFANLLRPRECAICGADRKAVGTLAASTCSVCRGPVDPDRAYLVIVRGSARAVGSKECLGSAVAEPLARGEACPACGSPWSEAAPTVRACRPCAKDLSWEAGYVGSMHAGRLTAFISPACLGMHDDRAYPFCRLPPAHRVSLH